MSEAKGSAGHSVPCPAGMMLDSGSQFSLTPEFLILGGLGWSPIIYFCNQVWDQATDVELSLRSCCFIIFMITCILLFLQLVYGKSTVLSSILHQKFWKNFDSIP